MPAENNVQIFIADNSTINKLNNHSQVDYRRLRKPIAKQREQMPQAAKLFIGKQEQADKNESWQNKSLLQATNEGRTFSTLKSHRQMKSQDLKTNLPFGTKESKISVGHFETGNKTQTKAVEGENGTIKNIEYSHPLENLLLLRIKPINETKANNSIVTEGKTNLVGAHKMKQRLRLGHADTLDQISKRKRRLCKKGWCNHEGEQWNHGTGFSNVQSGMNYGTGVSNEQGTGVPANQEWTFAAVSSPTSQNDWNHGIGSSSMSTTTTSTTTSNAQGSWGYGTGASNSQVVPSYEQTGFSALPEGCNYGTGVNNGGSSLHSTSYHTTGTSISQAATNHQPGETSSQERWGGCTEILPSGSTGVGGNGTVGGTDGSAGAGTSKGGGSGHGSVGGKGGSTDTASIGIEGHLSGGMENESNSGNELEQSMYFYNFSN